MKLRTKSLSIVLTLLFALPLTTSGFVPTVHANPPGTGGGGGPDCSAENAALTAAHTATVNAKTAYDNAWSEWRYTLDELIALNAEYNAMLAISGPNYTPYGNVYAYTEALRAKYRELQAKESTTTAANVAMILARDAWHKAQAAEIAALIALLHCLGLWP